MNMSERMTKYSDVSGLPITDRDDVVSIIVQSHPLLQEPVILDMSRDESDSMEIEEHDYVIADLVLDGGERHERVIIKQTAFDAMFITSPVDEVLAGAQRVRRPRSVVGRSVEGKVNYRELPNAGIPHRGRVTEEEAAVVRANIEEVNRNRASAGYEPIDPDNQKDADRYGFGRDDDSMPHVPDTARPSPVARA